MTRGDFTGIVKWIGLLDSRKYANAPFYVGINLDDPGTPQYVFILELASYPRPPYQALAILWYIPKTFLI